MRDLIHQLKQLCRHNREGSFGTQVQRERDLTLKRSRTKGGKARMIPTRMESQSEVLDHARKLAGKGSLIPVSQNYEQQVRIYDGHERRQVVSV